MMEGILWMLFSKPTLTCYIFLQKYIQVEGPHSMIIVERYHALIGRAYNIIKKRLWILTKIWISK